MLVDAEAALQTIDVTDKLRKYGVAVIAWPPIVGKLMDPCDSYFHSVEKRKYWKDIAMDPRKRSPQEMALAIRESYYSVPGSAVKDFFLRTGIIGNEDQGDVIENLMKEGLHRSSKYVEIHNTQHDAYLNFIY